MSRRRPYALSVARLSKAYLLADRGEDAMQLAQHALELSCDLKERGNEAWTLQLPGEIHRHQEAPAVEQAETSSLSYWGLRPL